MPYIIQVSLSEYIFLFVPYMTLHLFSMSFNSLLLISNFNCNSATYLSISLLLTFSHDCLNQPILQNVPRFRLNLITSVFQGYFCNLSSPGEEGKNDRL